MTINLNLKDIVCVRGHRAIFGPLSYHFVSGSLYLIAGPNGSGKTSLLYLIAGILKPYQGVISFDPSPIPSILFIDNRLALKPSLSVWENIRFLHGNCTADAIMQAFDDWLLTPHKDTPIYQLSVGWQQRVALCRLSLSESVPIWLLDEPFVHLDKAAQRQLVDLLNQRTKKGGLVLLTSHDYPADLPITYFVCMEQYQSILSLTEEDL